MTIMATQIADNLTVCSKLEHKRSEFPTVWKEYQPVYVLSVQKLLQNVLCSPAMQLLALQRRYNGRNGIPNHQPHDCLLNRLFRHISKKTSKLCVTGLCAGNYPWIPRTNGPLRGKCFHWWRHHGQLTPRHMMESSVFWNGCFWSILTYFRLPHRVP